MNYQGLLEIVEFFFYLQFYFLWLIVTLVDNHQLLQDNTTSILALIFMEITHSNM